jgi:hypothetical protein
MNAYGCKRLDTSWPSVQRVAETLTYHQFLSVIALCGGVFCFFRTGGDFFYFFFVRKVEALF